MKVNFTFKHPCRVSLAPGRIRSYDKTTVLEVGHNGRITSININEVPEEAWDNLSSEEFDSIMEGVKQVAEYIKVTSSYATGKISQLESAYNAWQKWYQDNAE